MIEFDWEYKKRYCSIGTIGAVVAIAGTAASAANTVNNLVSGPGGGSSGGGSSNLVGSGPGQPSLTSTMEPLSNQQESVAASVYNPAQASQNWVSIFSSMNANGTAKDTTSAPSDNSPADNITPASPTNSSITPNQYPGVG